MNKLEKLIGDALDKAVPYTWTKLDYDQTKHVERTLGLLIIKEVCYLLDREQLDKQQDWSCSDGTQIITRVKEHFGVEE